MSKKRILVTGGAGFLGTNLTARLLAEGNHVICIDNFLSGLREHVEPFKSNPDYELIEHDIIDPIDLEVDEIYNLACAGSPPAYQANPIHTTKTCVHGILNMLELAKKNDCKIMQASTSEVYGDPEVHPQVETYLGNVNPNGIRSCYDEGKRCAESLMFDHQRMYGTNIKIARIFNTYGPHMDPKDGRVVSNFIVQSLRGEPLTVYGDGSQTRSFCYVDDLLEGFIRLMASENFTGPVNLGNPGEFTVKELAEKTLQMINPDAKVTYLPLPADDPTKRRPDITLAKRELGWEPTIALDEGLKKTIAYFKSVI
ncbi:MAG: SDR family oxidoreductase [Gammaproteobacteria bacterium]|nr:SDR family oxidoreductase [Gammaproteobacteria bacterium]